MERAHRPIVPLGISSHALQERIDVLFDEVPGGASAGDVSGVERVAGQYYGRGGDQQFRLYVLVGPDTREILEKSQEFFRSHENTVYHVGYPTSYRQVGNVPNIQFSVSEDGTKADIDVDYRTSKMPQSMFNGHLTSSNSDVRAGDNYEKHDGRWSGYVAWWRGIFGDLTHEKAKGSRDLLSMEPPEPATPLPPDRRPGTPIVEVYDAVQEFLTDWLVRGEVEESLEFISDQMLACVDTDEDARDEILKGRDARDVLVEFMGYTVDEMKDRDNLTEAIDAVLPWDPKYRIVKHPFEGDFAVAEMTSEDTQEFLCTADASVVGTGYGTYYGALFRFKVDGGGVLGLIWMKEDGNWRIISYEAFEQ